MPAHNEELLIEACVASLLAQDVDPKMHRVVVIADNCTDATAARAAEAGAEVWTRHDPVQRGKGHALAWAVERLQDTMPSTAVVGVVDADCVASPGLCRAWSEAISRGVAGAQADYVVGNPADGGAAARRWAGFALLHRVRAPGKARLGLSAGLFGTGMAFSASTLLEVPWTSFSVTEDVEYHVRLVEHGERIALTPEAEVVTPALTTERDAQAQQLRWEAGNVALARRTVPRLLRDGLRYRDPQRLHLAAELVVPPQSLLAASLVAVGAASLITRDGRAARAAVVALAGQATYVLGGLYVAGAPAPVWRSLASSPALIIGKLGQFARIATGRGPTEWVRSNRQEIQRRDDDFVVPVAG